MPSQRKSKFTYASLIAFLLLIFGGETVASVSKHAPRGLTNVTHKVLKRQADNEILVKFRRSTPYSVKLNSISTRGGTRLQELGSSGYLQVRIKTGQSVAQALGQYKKDAAVEKVQPNYRYRILSVPNDPLYANQWGLRNTGQTVPDGTYPVNNPGTSGKDMDLESAWDEITDCGSVIVAVIDTGVNYTHEDLAANMWNGSSKGYPNHGWDFVEKNNNPMDKNGHGTHVAGTIGSVGDNGKGGTGVCWNVKIMALRVMDATGYGTTADIISGINFAVTNGARVINMSLGSPEFDQALSDSITSAGNAGVLVVTAAGNEADDVDAGESSYPCAFTHDNLLCVAAVDQKYDPATFTNYGKTSVDLAAPGTNIWSSWPGTTETIEDDFNTGGTLDWSIFMDDHWAYQDLYEMDLLTNPKNWDGSSKTYSPNINSYVYKNFGTIARDANVVLLEFFLNIDLYHSDYFRIYHYFGGFNIIDTYTNLTTEGWFYPVEYDISSLAVGKNSCEVDFRLSTNSTLNSYGVAITGFSLKALTYNNVTYEITDGTSMASPHVAGLAAMLLAFNPDYSGKDVVTSLKQGGTPVPALTEITATGKSANAWGSLRYINSPEGVNVSLEE